MKIACIASSQVPATTANSIQVMKACHALVQNNQQVSLWVPGKGEISWAAIQSHYGLDQEFDIQWLPSHQRLKRYDLAFNAVQHAVKWGAKLVYTWLPQVGVLAQMRTMPVILEVHDMPTGRIGPHLFQQFIRKRGKKRLLPITQALYNKLKKEYDFDLPEDQYLIAPNGTDMERYTNLPSPEEARRELGFPEGLTIGYTGHFYSGRGMELMIKLLSVFPEINFIFVGGQPEKVHNWQGYLQQDDYHNAYLTGFIENARLPLYQAAADILIMPYEESIAGSSGGNSAEICSPMKMFDYLASGRAIITSDLPVLHEVLNTNNAVFCPPGDIEAWQQALRKLADDKTLRQRLGTQARKDAAQYTWKARAANALRGFI